MTARSWNVALVLVLVLVAASALRPFHAEPAAQAPDTMQSLLVEVKGLRAAMEQLASAGPRVQLAFGRLQLHEQRINGFVRRLDAIRERLPAVAQEEENLRTRAAKLETFVRSDTPFEDERKDAEAQLPSMKAAAARAAATLQQLQAEEASILSEIGVEQARWTDINQRLEELERSLVRR